MRKISALLLLCLLTFSRVNGQSSEPMFRHFTPQDGLPSSQIYQILQDSSHYLWFATDHGLTRYNGYEFRNFTSADGLEDNTVLKLFLDKKKQVWMQTLSGKLFYFKENHIYPYQYNTVVTSLVKNNIPLSFCIDTFGRIRFTCSANSEYKIDTQGKVERVLFLQRTDNTNKVLFHEIEKGNFLSSANSIYSIDYPTLLYYSENGNRYDSLFIPEILDAQISVKRLRNGKLLLSLSHNLYEFVEGKLKFLAKVPATVTSIYEDSHERVWLSTYSGLFLFEKSSNYQFHRAFLVKEFITGVLEDHEGGMWVSSLNSGVFYLSNFKITSYFFNDDQLVDPTCLDADNEHVYAGFWDGSLISINSERIFDTHHFSERNYISSLYWDKLTKRLYLGKNPPGYMENNKFIPFKYSVTRSLKGNYLRRKNGDLLNVTANGLYKVSGDSVDIYFSIRKRSNCVFESEKGELLVGCNNGVFIINHSKNETTLYHPGLNNVRVDDIKESNGIMFFATRGRGLLILKNQKLYEINVSDGLCSNIIHHLAVNGNDVWCATYNGLSRVTFSDLQKLNYKISNIGFLEGLPNNEINDLVIFKDTIWIASKSAISFFSKQENFINAIPPEVTFNTMIVNNRDTIVTQNALLPYTSNNISIGFEAISFQSSGKINYRYQLIHESEKFQSVTTNRHVEFLALKPGSYIFNVEAQNSSGVWSKNIVSWHFSIKVPFWQKWWFLLLMSLLLLSGIYLIMRLRIQRIRKEEALKTDFNKQLILLEMKALRAQMNPHFIFNVINSIQDYILKNDARSAQRYLTKFAKLVRSILNNSVDGEVILIDEIKANELYMELEQLRFEEKFEFKLDVKENVESDTIVIPSMIIQPFLENAIKHGIRHLKSSGIITLQISQNDQELEILITDNGVGRTRAAELNKKNEQEHISYGSLITTRRVEAYNQAHNTKIQLKIIDIVDENMLPAGTRIELTIPLKFKRS